MKVLRIFLMVLAFSSHQANAQNDRNLAANKVNNAVSEQRVALVIGNSTYTNTPLKNPVNDAQDVAKKLRGLGFEVIERNNLKIREIGGTLREFRSKLIPGAVALVFYAGHGLQINGINYLPAVDADINFEEDVPYQSLAVRQIMDLLGEAKTRLNLVFLDACRNNPYARSFRSTERGLARVIAPSGTLISYATRPGSVAADGDGRNGLYTSKLLVQMDSHLQVEQVLKRVVTSVKAASHGKQEPWMEGSIEGNFCFAGCEARGSTAQAGSLMPNPVRIKTKAEIEQDAWLSVRDSGNINAIQEYLKEYPQGQYAGRARILIATLEPAPASHQPESLAVPLALQDAETALWIEVQKGGTVEDYRAYLSQYENGKYAVLAESRIKKIQGKIEDKKSELEYKVDRSNIIQTNTTDWFFSGVDHAHVTSDLHFDVGMGNATWGYGFAGVELKKADMLKVDVEAPTSYRHYDENSFAGFIIDYHSSDGYIKRIMLGIGVLDENRWDTGVPGWGRQRTPQYFSNIGHASTYSLDLQKWAPHNWDGRIWFTVGIQNAGENNGIQARLQVINNSEP